MRRLPQGVVVQVSVADALPDTHGRAAVQVQDMHAGVHDEGEPENAYERAQGEDRVEGAPPVPRLSSQVRFSYDSRAAYSDSHWRAH